MQTGINVTDPPVRPGVTINCYQYRVKHFRIHKVLETAAMLAVALLECDSNNSSGEVSARDSRNVNMAIAQIAREWAWAQKHRDAPNGQHELVFSIAFPTPAELQVMKNSKLKSIALELYNAFMVTLGSQSADMQVWVGSGSDADVSQAIDVLKEIVTEMIGDGAADTDGGFNTGVDAPNFSHVGQIVPSLSGGTEPAIQEPSKDAMPSKVPDSPDVTL